MDFLVGFGWEGNGLHLGFRNCEFSGASLFCGCLALYKNI